MSNLENSLTPTVMKSRVLVVCLILTLIFQASLVECFADRKINIKKRNPVGNDDLEQAEKISEIPLRWFRRVTRKSTSPEFANARPARDIMAQIMGPSGGQIYVVQISNLMNLI